MNGKCFIYKLPGEFFLVEIVIGGTVLSFFGVTDSLASLLFFRDLTGVAFGVNLANFAASLAALRAVVFLITIAGDEARLVFAGVLAVFLGVFVRFGGVDDELLLLSDFRFLAVLDGDFLFNCFSV